MWWSAALAPLARPGKTCLGLASMTSLWKGEAVIKAGDRAPDFVAKVNDGRELRLSELRDRVVVLYFFPKAFTPG